MYYYKEKKPRPFQKARTRPTILTAMNVVRRRKNKQGFVTYIVKSIS
jgi:hypothetical protein